MFEVDSHSRLPYGLGFDHVVKQQAELNLKEEARDKNSSAMDRLVDALGYMDYRDLLACNRYMLEAKLSKDY